ncbi:MAG: 50S ribosomal protein L9 [Proteobacteria bacterium]|nr:50S ribosomal protein L9 [Pseudomonadota bacterium]
MEVILQSDFPTLGYVGDRVEVANGYARNFLIPRGIAVEASSRNERQINHLLSAINVKKARLRGEAEGLAKRLEGVSLEFKLKVGEGGKTFGSITSKDIEAALKAQGFDILRKQIRQTEPFKKAGEYKVQVKLHSEVTATVSIKLALEGIVEKKEEGAPAKPARKGRGKKAAEESTPEGEAVSEGAAAAEAKADA